jgi:hypothetical protein
MNKTKNRRVVEKPCVPDFYEDLIEDIPTCLESYYLNDNLEQDNFPDEIVYKDSSDDEEIPEEEEEVETMFISPKGGTTRDEISSEAVHWFEPSDASEAISAHKGVHWFEPSDASEAISAHKGVHWFEPSDASEAISAHKGVHWFEPFDASGVVPAVVSQEDFVVQIEITPKPLTALSKPKRKTPCVTLSKIHSKSDLCIPAEEVQREHPGCPECPSQRPNTSFSPIYPIEDEILSIFTDSADKAAVPDETSGALTRLEVVQLSDIPMNLHSPVPSSVFCPVSEATHYFSQYLEVRLTTRGCSPTHTTNALFISQPYRTSDQ